MICTIHAPIVAIITFQLFLSAKDHTVSEEEFEIWECKHCTQRFTQNIPEEDKIGKYYQSQNYISHSDTSKGFINNLSQSKKTHAGTKKKTGRKNNREKNRKYPGCGCRYRRFFTNDATSRLEQHRY